MGLLDLLKAAFSGESTVKLRDASQPAVDRANE